VKKKRPSEKNFLFFIFQGVEEKGNEFLPGFA